MANDIVIVKLAKSLTFNANVQPACLPEANFFPDKQTAVVSGWGMLKWDGSEDQAEGINKTFMLKKLKSMITRRHQIEKTSLKNSKIK